MIAAIGATNAFVLRQAITREHISAAVLACCLGETLLFFLADCGVGGLIEKSEVIRLGALWLGVAFLLLYGGRIWFEKPDPEKLLRSGAKKGAKGKVFWAGFCLSILNPQVILEVVILIGALAAQYPPLVHHFNTIDV